MPNTISAISFALLSVTSLGLATNPIIVTYALLTQNINDKYHLKQ
jgi:hypothetical protein